jgi:glycosyltransferase involved in cell wall biosynthesis
MDLQPKFPSEFKVSVVIPAYNYGKFLPQAVDSALKQTHLNREIIVIDDGSTDDTAELMKGYGDKIRYIYKENAGLSAARNTGIEVARFDYIAFLDADDEWLPKMLEKAMQSFSELPPEYGLVACRNQHFDGDGAFQQSKKLDKSPSREITFQEIILKSRFSPSAVVVKRRVFQQCGDFDITLRSSEDRDMWIRIGSKYRMFLRSERLALIRRHSNNMSKHADRMKANVRQVISKSYAARLVSPWAFVFWMQVYSFHFFQNAWRFRDEERYFEAMKEMLLSIFICPLFFDTYDLNEPILFRFRSIVRFFRESLLKAISRSTSVPCKLC